MHQLNYFQAKLSRSKKWTKQIDNENNGPLLITTTETIEMNSKQKIQKQFLKREKKKNTQVIDCFQIPTINFFRLNIPSFRFLKATALAPALYSFYTLHVSARLIQKKEEMNCIFISTNSNVKEDLRYFFFLVKIWEIRWAVEKENDRAIKKKKRSSIKLFFPKRENKSSTHRLVSHTWTEDTIGLDADAFVFFAVCARETSSWFGTPPCIDRALWNDRQEKTVIKRSVSLKGELSSVSNPKCKQLILSKSDADESKNQSPDLKNK